MFLIQKQTIRSLWFPSKKPKKAFFEEKPKGSPAILKQETFHQGSIYVFVRCRLQNIEDATTVQRLLEHEMLWRRLSLYGMCLLRTTLWKPSAPKPKRNTVSDMWRLGLQKTRRWQSWSVWVSLYWVGRWVGSSCIITLVIRFIQ